MVVNELGALVRTLAYVVCALVFLYRGWLPGRWRLVYTMLAMQFTMSVVVAMLTIIKPGAIPATRLYVLTPLVVVTAVVVAIQLITDCRRR